MLNGIIEKNQPVEPGAEPAVFEPAQVLGAVTPHPAGRDRDKDRDPSADQTAAVSDRSKAALLPPATLSLPSIPLPAPAPRIWGADDLAAVPAPVSGVAPWSEAPLAFALRLTPQATEGNAVRLPVAAWKPPVEAKIPEIPGPQPDPRASGSTQPEDNTGHGSTSVNAGTILPGADSDANAGARVNEDHPVPAPALAGPAVGTPLVEHSDASAPSLAAPAVGTPLAEHSEASAPARAEGERIAGGSPAVATDLPRIWGADNLAAVPAPVSGVAPWSEAPLAFALRLTPQATEGNAVKLPVAAWKPPVEAKIPEIPRPQPDPRGSGSTQPEDNTGHGSTSVNAGTILPGADSDANAGARVNEDHPDLSARDDAPPPIPAPAPDAGTVANYVPSRSRPGSSAPESQAAYGRSTGGLRVPATTSPVSTANQEDAARPEAAAQTATKFLVELGTAKAADAVSPEAITDAAPEQRASSPSSEPTPGPEPERGPTVSSRPPSAVETKRSLVPEVKPPSRSQQRAQENASPEPEQKNPKPVEKADARPAARNARLDPAPPASEAAPRPAETPATREVRSGPARSDEAKVETLAVEPEVNPAVHAQPTRQISLRLSGADATNVDVQLRERAGRVQVAVRTGDSQLTQALQSDLGDLVNRLESKGYKTEAWIPATAHPAAAAAPGVSEGGAEHGQRQPSGSWAGNEQQRHGQQGSNQRQQSRGKARFEETLATSQEARTENR